MTTMRRSSLLSRVSSPAHNKTLLNLYYCSDSDDSDEDISRSPLDAASTGQVDDGRPQPSASAQALSFTMPCPSSLSPLSSLPIELLIHIFALCVTGDPDASTTLALVCHEWRTILLTSPRLWPHLRLSDSNGSIVRESTSPGVKTSPRFDSQKAQRKAALWLVRSASLPLDVTLDTGRPNSVLPMLSHVVPGVARWRDVTYYQSRMRFLTAQDGAEPCLEALHIMLAPRALGNEDDGDVDMDPEDELQQALEGGGPVAEEAGAGAGAGVGVSPTSQQQSYAGVGLPTTKLFGGVDHERLREVYVLSVRRLPSPAELTPFATVTMLNLMNGALDVDFPMHDVVPFLAAFPALEQLGLANYSELLLWHDGADAEAAAGARCSATKRAHLPHLRRLTVRGICASRCVLAHLAAPRLQTLALVHINSAEVYTAPPFPGRYEPGDSEDEARDFSRSPWTDHATGTGLRRLFAGRKSRSRRVDAMDTSSEEGSVDEVEASMNEEEEWHPPLRELVMDYADMRTKDFKWVFARLTHLELFDIVASDMSDNVVRALEVVDTLEGDAAHPPVLPALTRLRLTRCQKVSGDGFVRMIASRVRSAQAGRIAMLQELSIIECMQINVLHNLELQQILLPVETALHYSPGFGDD